MTDNKGNISGQGVKSLKTQAVKDAKLSSLRIANAILLPEVIGMLNEGHSVTLPLRGYSMRPFLEDGRDKALFTAVDKANIHVGDAVLAEIKPGVYVLHRIISISGNNVRLRGDGNLTSEYCVVDDIKALATAFYRKGRTTPDSVDGRKWKVYSRVWMALYPIRRYLLFIHRHYIRIFK